MMCGSLIFAQKEMENITLKKFLQMTFSDFSRRGRRWIHGISRNMGIGCMKRGIRCIVAIGFENWIENKLRSSYEAIG